MVFIASMTHAHVQKPVLSEKPDVTCSSDVQEIECRKEVVHHEEVPGHPKSKKNSGDKKPTFTIKAKSIPVTPKTVAATTGPAHAKWLLSIYKEIENFLQNMVITDADPALIIKFKSMGKWPLPCQMVFVLKPLTQIQQTEDDADQDYKHKSRLGDLWQLCCMGRTLDDQNQS